MLPTARPVLPQPLLCLKSVRAGVAALALVALGCPLAAQAQSLPDRQQGVDNGDAAVPQPRADQPASDNGPDNSLPAAGDQIQFEADGASYDSNADLVTVFGNVVLRRDDQSVRADRIVWDRKSGQIVAEGNIRAVDADGNQLFTDRLELDEELKAGAMENMLLALREGGRLAAMKGERLDDGTVLLHNAAYTACAVEDDKGCPRRPSWRITAKRVIYDPDRKLVTFQGAQPEIFGLRLPPLPGIKIATDGRPISGLLIPNLQLSPSNGVQISETWYQRLSDNRDLAVTGYLFTGAPPMVSAQYRQLTSEGALQVTGYATRSSRIPVGSPTGASQPDFRGYLFANGRFQFDPNWSLTFSARVTSDRTFLRRYDISRDDRLRSTVQLEHIDADSYFSIAGWATQTLRVGDAQGLVPIALPEIDYRRRLTDPLLGGNVTLQLNTLAITRTDGQDTQRAFASAQWDMRRLTPWGQELTVTALGRADVYHSDENALTPTVVYRGNPGWQYRGIGALAFDAKWPLIGEFMGGTQVLTPRIQVVASPTLKNLEVPNEDARAIDLEDSNLFALNRFPGYDRVEDGVRFTYGLDWQFERPGLRIITTIGQSYRLSSRPTLLPDGTGLSERTSDVVGRTEVRFKDFLKLTHRFRLDKDNFAVRRNEFDAAIGTQGTYLEAGYLRLNRDVGGGIEDLKDREEARLAGRISVAKYWSIFGSGVFDLTGQNDDPTLPNADGFQPIRTRLGVAYEDDCIEMGLTWRRDYLTTGDAQKGNTYQFYISVKNLGF